jgi:thioredoxin 1
MAASNIVTLTQENFEKEVLQSATPVLVDFWAEWCGPCKMLSPILDQLAGEYDGRIKICKANTDEQQTLAVQFGVSAIPTLLVFKQGQVVEQMRGFKGHKDLKAKLDGALA